MFKYNPDHRRVFDTADNSHDPLTFRTDQGINFIDLLNQSCPAFPERLHIPLWFKDAGDSIIIALLLTLTPRDVAVVAIIPHHLLALV